MLKIIWLCFPVDTVYSNTVIGTWPMMGGLLRLVQRGGD